MKPGSVKINVNGVEFETIGYDMDVNKKPVDFFSLIWSMSDEHVRQIIKNKSNERKNQETRNGG